MTSSVGKAPELDFDSPHLRKHRQWRALKDKTAKHAIAAGGLSVIVAVTLIFFYLLYEVVPLFKSASMVPQATYAVPGASDRRSLLLALDEQAEKGLRLDERGQVTFFNTADGSFDRQFDLPVSDQVKVTAVNEGSPGSRLVSLGFSDGRALLFQHNYKAAFDQDGVRTITPELAFPDGDEPVELAPTGVAIEALAVRSTEDNLMYIAVGEDGVLYGRFFSKEVNFLTQEVTLEQEDLKLPEPTGLVERVLLSPDTRWLYLVMDSGDIVMYDIGQRSRPQLVDTVNGLSGGQRITDVRFLLGGFALLVANDQGRITQWFPVRDESNRFSLQEIRSFDSGSTAAIAQVTTEERRKGFVSASVDGTVAFFNTTAHRRALVESISDKPIVQAVIAPRANYFLAETADKQLHLWKVDNKHADVSLSALWGKVWYEGYDQPEYIWQSSAANNDFEPKYSLVPLSFGTLKAAFYAMLLAVPLAICGAIYTAHFMAPAVRRKVKPSIELMEALPTVILGFLAGLFLAPFMEEHLPGVFVALILIPVSIVVFGFLWANMPKSIRLLVPEGWDPILLVPVICLVGWFSFAISGNIEVWFFDGDMRLWLTRDMGIDYSQRNSLVIGVAMGIAVIPTIFSITEDAIFSVPKHLTFGSLALGATPWQTLSRVVLPTASPGIFSAVMIGLGRAVGETMIVLMATGNTPIMDMNIFEGMRTLSANIAVEMPESEVGSSHFRILFLAGFVLFLFTFVVNTLAEFVRQRLRNKYSVI